MSSPAQIRCDVAVVGAGPAGISAAIAAAEAGASVALLDDNPAAGGQIWRGGKASSTSAEISHWFDRLERSSIQRIHNARVFHAEPNHLFAETNQGVHQVAYKKLILATGARERFLPFPGWTFPNVLGAGALQALIKSGLPVENKRIVIAGTGPLLFAAAECALAYGANVLCIAEQCDWPQYRKFAMRMLFESTKRSDALRLAWRLRNIPHWKNAWPVAALGSHRLEAVRLSHSGRTKDIPCDYFACGFHLVPNIELAASLGCQIANGLVAVDTNQQTSVPNVYCAGEPTGIAGVEAALLEGKIAGHAAAGQREIPSDLRAKHAASKRVMKTLQEATKLRRELAELAREDTLVCRCEDVSLGQLRAQNSGSSAKLQARCGMGACQGRVCGPIVEFLFGWNLNRQRPPLFPVRCSSLAAIGAGTAADGTSGG
jgi:D-hydroxyproline dehydrogenase subunit alpha